MHRTSALVVALFVVVHLAGHLAGLAGAAAHQTVLEALRVVYRQPALEVLLLGCVAFQMGSGLMLLWRGHRQRRGAVTSLQAVSGAYLCVFLLVHVAAVLHGRSVGVDTNLQFAAAGLHTPPWQWFFGPYYFMAVAAIGAHVGCALYWHLAERVRGPVLAGALLAGLVLGACLVAMLAGGLGPVDLVLAGCQRATPASMVLTGPA
ncbi:hypothetical protein [Acidovorax sp. BL-A-41-H1]|uniref:hypothetical protein n=1 Tax=Acidovorax sp. BL-A-41-H1 TaxID=3421102 RepID=UPI003F7AD8FA